MPTLPTLRRAVRAATPALAVGTAALTAILAACADSPTGPAASASASATAGTQAFVAGPHASVSTTTTSVNVLTRTTALNADVTAATTVMPSGGTLSVPQAGLTVRFPAGFVNTPTTFTVTAKHGAAIAYEFSPSGTFSAPVTITQQLAGTNWRAIPDLTQVKGGYLRSWTQLTQNAQGDQNEDGNSQGATATANELLPAQVSTSAGTITFGVNHFSGYLVSWGHR